MRGSRRSLCWRVGREPSARWLYGSSKWRGSSSNRRLISNGARNREHARRAPWRRCRRHERNHPEAAATEAESWNVIVSPPLSVKSVRRTGRCRVRELPDDVANPKPDYLAGGVASCPELIGMTSAFLSGPVAIAFKHQVRDAPDVDLGYHAAKARRGSRIKA